MQIILVSPEKESNIHRKNYFYNLISNNYIGTVAVAESNSQNL